MALLHERWLTAQCDDNVERLLRSLTVSASAHHTEVGLRLLHELLPLLDQVRAGLRRARQADDRARADLARVRRTVRRERRVRARAEPLRRADSRQRGQRVCRHAAAVHVSHARPAGRGGPTRADGLLRGDARRERRAGRRAAGGAAAAARHVEHDQPSSATSSSRRSPRSASRSTFTTPSSPPKRGAPP
jgi:hypothetical protein